MRVNISWASRQIALIEPTATNRGADRPSTPVSNDQHSRTTLPPSNFRDRILRYIRNALSVAATYSASLHCIIPYSGLLPDRTRWAPCRPGFCLRMRVLSRRLRTLILTRLQAAFAARELLGHAHAKARLERRQATADRRRRGAGGRTLAEMARNNSILAMQSYMAASDTSAKWKHSIRPRGLPLGASAAICIPANAVIGGGYEQLSRFPYTWHCGRRSSRSARRRCPQSS
jgi:hypothetical protein